MTDAQFIGLGKLFAAHSLMTSNVIGVMGHLVQNEAEVTAALYPYITPSDRVHLCIRLLELDSQRHGVSATAYRRLDLALRGVLEKMLVEFSLPGLELDIQMWVENESDPWPSFTLDVDPADLERAALGLFSQTAELLASVAVYLQERSTKGDRATAS